MVKENKKVNESIFRELSWFILNLPHWIHGNTFYVSEDVTAFQYPCCSRFSDVVSIDACTACAAMLLGWLFEAFSFT